MSDASRLLRGCKGPSRSVAVFERSRLGEGAGGWGKRLPSKPLPGELHNLAQRASVENWKKLVTMY